MVKAIVDISEQANRLLNILKAKYSLKDKSSAINLMAEQYEKQVLDTSLRPSNAAKRGRLPVVVYDSQKYFG